MNLKLAKLAPTYEYSNNLCLYQEMFSEEERKHIEEKLDVNFKSSPKEQVACKRQIHIAVFFDDTGCNYVDDLGSNDLSNIAKLYNAFPGKGVKSSLFQAGESAGSIPSSADIKPDEFDNCFKIYVPGVGTKFQTIGDNVDKKISPYDLAKSDSVKSWTRIYWAVAHVLNSIHRFCLDDKDNNSMITSAIKDKSFMADRKDVEFSKILYRILYSSDGKGRFDGQINLSIFGAGRGAMAARAFTNLLVDTSNKPDLAAIEFNEALKDGDTDLSSYERLVKPQILPFKFKYLGLFDSISGVGSLPLEDPNVGTANIYRYSHKEWANEKNSRINQKIDKCTHIVSAHEIRRSFSVDSILYNAADRGGYLNEYVYPGAHQDVVGGNAYGYKNKSSGSEISFITLAHIYRSARLSGVPFRAELMEDGALKSQLVVNFDVIKYFNAYTKYIRGGRNNGYNSSAHEVIFASKDILSKLIHDQYLYFLRHKSTKLSTIEEKEEFDFFKSWRFGEITEEENKALLNEYIGYGDESADRYLDAKKDWLKGLPTYYTYTKLIEDGNGDYKGIGQENSKDSQIRREWAYIKQSEGTFEGNGLEKDIKQFFENYVTDSRKDFLYDNVSMEPSHIKSLYPKIGGFGAGYLRLRRIFFGDYEFELNFTEKIVVRFFEGVLKGIIDTPRAFASGAWRLARSNYMTSFSPIGIFLRPNRKIVEEDTRFISQAYKLVTSKEEMEQKIRIYAGMNPEEIVKIATEKQANRSSQQSGSSSQP